MDARFELGAILKRINATIAAAESLTGGHVQANIAMVSGASTYFLGGITAYNIHQKTEHLGVDGRHAAEVNCVSQQVVREMATGARAMFGADIGIATTGYAESDIMPRHTMAAGACIRCGAVDMAGGRSDECEYKPHAWVGFNVLGFQWEEQVVPEDAPWLTGQDGRVAVQEEIAMVVIEKLVDWLNQVKGKGEIYIPAVRDLVRRGL
jgi:PncC family amidohydrolase